MTNREKIRPPTHSTFQPSPAEIREEAERDLRETVRMPDPGARAEASGAINAADPSPPPGAAWPDTPPGAFTPDETVELRRRMNDPNRLGRPRQNSTAEELLITYQRTLREHREEYARDGKRSMAKERPFLEAKQAMIDAGLMKGDV